MFGTLKFTRNPRSHCDGKGKGKKTYVRTLEKHDNLCDLKKNAIPRIAVRETEWFSYKKHCRNCLCPHANHVRCGYTRMWLSTNKKSWVEQINEDKIGKNTHTHRTNEREGERERLVMSIRTKVIVAEGFVFLGLQSID